MTKIRLPRISINPQAHSVLNLLRFFAAMLVLTLLARGASNAVLPTVTLSKPVAGNIIKRIEAKGEITAFSSASVFAVPDILIEKVLVRNGEQIDKGQKIAVFSQEEADLSIEKLKANIEKKQAEKAQLLYSAAPDSSGISSAQLMLDRAYAAYTSAAENYNLLLSDPNTEPAALAAAKQAVDAAVASAQEAEVMRSSAIDAYQKQEVSLSKTNGVNSAQAKLTDIEIDELQEKLNSVYELVQNEYALLSPENGIVAELSLQDGKPSQKLACQIRKTDDGLCMQFVLDSNHAQSVSIGTPLEISQDIMKEKTNISSLSVINADEVLITAHLKESFKTSTASAIAVLSNKKYEFCILPQAVNADNSGTFVYVIEQKNTVLGIKNVCVRVPVTILEQDENSVAVSGALGYDSQIISSFSRPVSAGSTVKVIQ